MYIKWIPNLKDNQILLTRQSIHDVNNVPQRLLFHFGTWSKEVEVLFTADLSEDTIGLPQDLVKHFIIPDVLPYEIYIDGANLYLGPVIAFIISGRNKLTPEILNDYESYYKDYPEIKGLVYICTSYGMNTVNKTIKGYYYCPNAEEEKASWKYGVFTYPEVIYRRTDIIKKYYDDLVKNVGKNIFNSYFFNKWELWKWLSPYPHIREHLPYTIKLENFQSFEDMINQYGSVYLKPFTGHFAEGVLKAERTEKGYRFVDRYRGEKLIGKPEEVSVFFKRLNKNKRYIIQQAVPFTYRNKMVDFRVILQKDRSKQWNCSGIIARQGRINGISTNETISITLGKHALQKMFQMNEEQSLRKEQEMIQICTNACEILDKSHGHYGDVGVDVIIDHDFKVWIVEINNKCHDHEVALYVKGDPQMYDRVVTRPFEYAKSLAGLYNSRFKV